MPSKNSSDKNMEPTSTFMEKLKEQSFSIIIMAVVAYYQHQLFVNDHEEIMRLLAAERQKVVETTDKERERFIKREEYLLMQRDQFIEMLKENAARCKKD
jgi:peroxiredoxin